MIFYSYILHHHLGRKQKFNRRRKIKWLPNSISPPLKRKFLFSLIVREKNVYFPNIIGQPLDSIYFRCYLNFKINNDVGVQLSRNPRSRKIEWPFDSISFAPRIRKIKGSIDFILFESLTLFYFFPNIIQWPLKFPLK